VPRFIGIGKVLEDGRELATVSYSLLKTMHPATAKLGKVSEQPYSTKGDLRVLRGRIPMAGGTMTLRMENGNEVLIRLTESIVVPEASGLYRVRVTGNPGA
jgi:hypothetical protein